MALNVKRLRIWFATAGLLLIAVVAGFFFYARYRVHRTIEEVRKLPKKYGIDIQQTTQGFNFSKSEGGHTLFSIRAAKTFQFKTGNRAELQDVSIIVYGRNSDRFDQIYGKKFEYDPQTGVVTAAGEVQIDLEGNTDSVPHPDQAAPAEMKNPIHLKTSGLSFNSKTGMAHTAERVEFRTPQAVGSAVGADYDSKQNQMTLLSAVAIHTSGDRAADIYATHAVITKEPLLAALDNVRSKDAHGDFAADHADIYFRPDSTVEHAIAQGNVNGARAGATSGKFRAERADVWVNEENMAKNAVLSGGAVVDATGERPMHAEASRVLVDFGPKNQVAHVRGIDNVKLVQLTATNAKAGRSARSKSPAPSQANAARSAASAGELSTPASGTQAASPAPVVTQPGQTLELTAGAVDVDVRDGRLLQRAWTSGPAQIVTTQQQAANGPPARTVITAGRFDAAFDTSNRLKSLHGSPDAKMVSQTQGQPDRVTTSRELDVVFNPGGSGIASMTQTGDFHYAEGARIATAEHARYTTADELFELTGNARYSETANPGGSTPAQKQPATAAPTAATAPATQPNASSLSMSANTLRLNRRTGAINADGDVKTTYADLKPQPNGALLASGSPIHVTAAHMAARRSSPAPAQGRTATRPAASPAEGPTSVARYSGNARLWQEANIVEAPVIDFDRDKRTMVAQGSGAQLVSTVFVQQDKQGKVTPVNVTAAQLTYNDADRRARFSGGVVMKGRDATVTSDRADVFLVARTAAGARQPSAAAPAGGAPAPQSTPASLAGGPSQVQQIVAEGQVVIQEPTRKATGEKLVYTAAEQKFVLTGGPPSIFDAEHGTITGASLTFYSRDDRVLVEGSASQSAKSQPKSSK